MLSHFLLRGENCCVMIHMYTHYISMHHVNHSESYPSWQKNKAAVVPINSIMTDSDEGAHIEVKKKKCWTATWNCKVRFLPSPLLPWVLGQSESPSCGLLVWTDIQHSNWYCFPTGISHSALTSEPDPPL